jgi:6-pyruvoyltetrahydropterin/6-carboxytetrahydropterin synthase
MLVDFKSVKSALAEVVAYLDHRYLNELSEFRTQNPTAELIAKLIFDRMRDRFGDMVCKVTVWETPTSSASYTL